MKKLYIHCDGGFGNRFNSLIFGLSLAKKCGINPIISWPSTNVCRALFDDIFEYDCEVVEKRLEDYTEIIDQYELLIHEDQLMWNYPFKSTSDFRSFLDVINYCTSSDKDNIFYFNNLIPNYKDNDLSIISNLKFKSDYYKLANVGKEYTGVHLRSTDFTPGSIDYDKIFNLIKENATTSYFVCSDSKDLETKFNELDNVFINPKTSYVKKIDESKEWRVYRGQIKDERNKNLSFNVERNTQSVKEAIVDLIILSKSTKILLNSNSTFLTTAILLKEYGQK